MRAVGGEFAIDPRWLARDPDPALAGPRFASGRAALRAIAERAAEARGVRDVLVPEYVCGSVPEAIRAAGLEVTPYAIGDRLSPDPATLIEAAGSGPDRAVLLVDYFGLVDLEPLARSLRDAGAGCTIVCDQVQALFAIGSVPSADYEFASLRKWLPAPDGAPVLPYGCVAPAGDGESAWASAKAFALLLKHDAEAAGVPDDVWLGYLDAAERMLDASEAAGDAMSDASKRIHASVDMDAVAAARIANFRHLEAGLAPLGLPPVLPLKDGMVPLAYPVLTPRRDALRAALAAARVFAPVHWPMPARPGPGAASRLWTDELSLPIDQRYGPVEMDRIIAVFKENGGLVDL